MHNFLKSVLLPALLAMSSSPMNQEKYDGPGVDEGWSQVYWTPNHLDNNILDNGTFNNDITPDSEMEQMADELQRQIDQLRKQINEIIKESENTEDEGTVANLKKQMEDLQVQVQDLYKKVDQLSSELQQEFRQKLDALAKEMAEAHKKLEDRVKDLEDLVQKMAISQCIGNLRDGMVETALGTFRHIKYPNLHIEQIISDAYRNVNDCKILNSFLSKIESEVELRIRTKGKNEIRARGYFSLYNHLSKDQFTPEGSDCTYPLAWNVKEIQNRLKSEEIISKDYTSRVLRKLPKSISKFTVDKLVKLSIPFREGENEIMTCYKNDRRLGNGFIISGESWNTTQTEDGSWFVLFNQDERPLTYYPVVLFEHLYLNMNKYPHVVDHPTSLFKPTAISNSQFYLEVKEGGSSGSYLRNIISGEDRYQCYYFKMGPFDLKTVYSVE